MNRKNNWYEIRAAAGAAEVFIYGDIGEGWNDETITAKKFVEDLAAIQARELLIRINSVGGSVTDGLAIYNAIKRHPASVEVAIDGVAASVASMIAMAGDKITAAANALLMVHGPWSLCQGDATDMREMAATLDKHAEAMAAAYQRSSGPDEAAIKGWLTDGQDHWFTASEALEIGLIDEITEELQIAASLDLSRYGTLPEKVKAMTQKNTPQDNPAPNKPVHVAEVSAALLERNQQIMAMHNLTPNAQVKALCVAALADPNISLEQTRQKALEIVGNGYESVNDIPQGQSYWPVYGQSNDRIEYGRNSHHDEFIAACTDALLLRGGVSVAKPHAAARDLQGMRLVDIARTVNGWNRGGFGPGIGADRGSDRGFSPHNEIRAAMTSSDFPLLLANVADKALMMGYENEPASHRIWTRKPTRTILNRSPAWRYPRLRA